jgi:hypothetical protein
MASAGVVGMADVIVPNSNLNGGGSLNGTPAMWSFIWVGLAILFLTFIHMALIGRASR